MYHDRGRRYGRSDTSGEVAAEREGTVNVGSGRFTHCTYKSLHCCALFVLLRSTSFFWPRIWKHATKMSHSAVVIVIVIVVASRTTLENESPCGFVADKSPCFSHLRPGHYRSWGPFCLAILQLGVKGHFSEAPLEIP